MKLLIPKWNCFIIKPSLSFRSYKAGANRNSRSGFYYDMILINYWGKNLNLKLVRRLESVSIEGWKAILSQVWVQSYLKAFTFVGVFPSFVLAVFLQRCKTQSWCGLHSHILRITCLLQCCVCIESFRLLPRYSWGQSNLATKNILHSLRRFSVVIFFLYI